MIPPIDTTKATLRTINITPRKRRVLQSQVSQNPNGDGAVPRAVRIRSQGLHLLRQHQLYPPPRPQSRRSAAGHARRRSRKKLTLMSVQLSEDVVDVLPNRRMMVLPLLVVVLLPQLRLWVNQLRRRSGADHRKRRSQG